MTRPATMKRDQQVWRRWASGEDPKRIMTDMDLTKDQFYKGLHRERVRLQAKTNGRNKAKKGESKKRRLLVH